MVQDYEKPAAVVFDIVFTSDDDELDLLVDAMAALEEKKIDLFFVRDTEDRDTSNYDAMVTKLATRIYDSFSNYRLHTEFIELDGVVTDRLSVCTDCHSDDLTGASPRQSGERHVGP